MGEQIKELLNKIPYVLVTAGYFIFLGYQYYNFNNSNSSPLKGQERKIGKLNLDIQKLKKRKKELAAFERNLDVKREELRTLAVRLGETKASLSEDLDIPALVKTVFTEARRVGLRVTGIRPRGETVKEFYIENGFEVPFRGVFAQLVVFLERLASVNEIIRVDQFTIKPSGPANARFVELGGIVQLKAFRYTGSKADEIAKDNAFVTTDAKGIHRLKNDRTSLKTKSEIRR